MKLRTQLALLVGGIIVVPFLVAASVIWLQYSSARRNEPRESSDRIASLLRRELPPADRTRELRLLAERRPPGMDIVMFGPDGVVAFSTLPDFPAGKGMDQAKIIEYVRANPRTSLVHIDDPQAGGSGQALLLLKASRLAEPPPFFRKRQTEIVVYTSLSLLLISSLASFLIVRTFNRSIRKLAVATRRVAEGDLDFALPVKGSDEISSLTRSFDRMRQALKEEYARRTRFIMGVSHDLKTPLTLIQGYVEAIADGFAADPDVQKRYLAIILDKTRDLDRLITDLIEFVKMDTGEWRMTHREVRVRGFLIELSKRFTEDALILKRDFRFSIDLPENCTILMDEGLFRRALENLAGNAIRYTEQGAMIELSAQIRDGELVLSIKDTGIGIPQEDIPRIFDPFYRGTNSRREQGFGLGLATVRTILESHGWRIDVASEQANGTTFTIHMGAPA